MKLTNKHIKQFIKEEISNLLEAPFSPAPFAGIPKDEKNPKMPSETINAALYPFRRPKQIAYYSGLSGGRDKLYELSGEELEPLSFSGELSSVYETHDLACEGNLGSGVLLYFDTPGLIPGHDVGHTVGFKKMSDLQNFFKALRKASLQSVYTKTDKEMVLDCYYTWSTKVPGLEGGLEDNKITVGIRPIWNIPKQTNEMAVMLNFGGPKTTHSSGKGGPYFMTQDAAAQLSEDWKKSIEPLLTRNNNKPYQEVSVLDYPPELLQSCLDRKEKVAPRTSTARKNSDTETMPGFANRQN